MRKLSVFFLIWLLSMQAQAVRAIQVPEDCAGSRVPCLIKAQDKYFKFSYLGHQFRLAPQAIVKLSLGEQKVAQLEILSGAVSVTRDHAETTLTINSIINSSSRTFASRKQNELRILDADLFVLSRYRIETDKGIDYAVQMKSGFVSKTELVGFVKDHFSQIRDLKSYLKSIESKWLAEFKVQNQMQQKVLMRSIASEEAELEKRAEERRQQEEMRKKTRSRLFYRTFER